MITEKGRLAWQASTDYGWRSLAALEFSANPVSSP
jgi:hypothetical protein